MVKRLVAVPTWFFAVWVFYELIWSLTGAPRVVGPILATAVTAFVAVDPAGLFWPRSAEHTVRAKLPTRPRDSLGRIDPVV